MLTFLVPATGAAAPRPQSGAELQRALERTATVGSVLYVAAHPDDENTRLLAWLVNGPKVRAAYLSLTRGEGGQNLIGPELSPLLGVIRTHELLAARAIDGAEQLFGMARDFGYSKTPEETLQIWGKREALGDVVWAIRRFRPDVIVTRFSPDARDTHGHHTASAMLAVEAFSAAADPEAFPEQLLHTSPWQARRVVWNKGLFGPARPGETDGFVKLDIGDHDPLLGVSAGELAARSRSMHKSQGFGASPQRGPIAEYFKLLAGEPFQKTFLDGVDLSWRRVPGGARIAEILDRARAQFRPHDPAASVPVLLDALVALDAAPDSASKRERRAALVELVLGCAGVILDATSPQATAVPGEVLPILATLLNRSAVPLQLHALVLGGKRLPQDKPVPRGPAITVEHAGTLDAATPWSTPYWLTAPPSAGRWAGGEAGAHGLPEQPSPLRVGFEITLGGHALLVDRPVEHAWTDPTAGERRRPIEIVPPVLITAARALVAFPDKRPQQLVVTVRATRGAQRGSLRATAPGGFVVTPAELPFVLAATDAEASVTFQITPPASLGERASIAGSLTLVAHLADHRTADRTAARIDYPHLPMQTIVEPATVRLSRFEMKRGRARLGYVPGAGDDVAAALQQVGYDVTLLDGRALQQPLSAYEAIVVGIRAFNVNPKLAAQHDRLMAYVEAGGTLIVQYNTSNRLGKLDAPLGPWPFTISQERVTEEHAAIQRLVEHPVFTTPNAIGDRDFADWVQERGLYFASPFDARYAAPLGMNDTGEPQKKGALLIGAHGKGRFVYTGLSFFRQLPAGVPGAFRLFANLLGAAPVTRGKRGK